MKTNYNRVEIKRYYKNQVFDVFITSNPVILADILKDSVLLQEMYYKHNKLANVSMILRFI